MSEPWPPAFIRTAPPTEPGTPTAHSNPVSAGGGRAPGEHGQGHAAAGRRRRRAGRRPPTSIAGAGRRRDDGDAGEARVGDEQVGAAADDEHGSPDARRAAATATRSASVRARTNSAAGAADAVRRQRAERLVAASPARRGTARPRRARRRRRRAHRRPPAPRSPGEHLLGQRGDVAAPHRDAHVARADLAGQERHDVVAARAATRTRARGWASTHGVDDQLAGDARDRRRARRVDLGDHDDVGADEGVAVLLPHLGDAVEAVGLEGDDDPPPPVAAVAGGGDDGGDLGRQVAVVVDERGAAVDAADVEAPGDAAEAGQRRRGRPRTGHRARGPWRWRRWR